MKKTVKNYLKFFVKLSLTIAALYFVFRKIDIEKFYETLKNANFFYFVLAIISFNASKLISAFRLNNFFKAIDLQLKSNFNLKLYWVGMFYNLFLPGSIGGDGYKVYLINQLSPNPKLKSIITATFLDRTSGMVFLLFIALFLLFFSSLPASVPFLNYFLIFSLLSVIPVYYLCLKILFPKFLSIFWETSYQAFFVQVGQLVCAYFLLLSLSINEGILDYLALFMIASVVSVLPLTIGGIGLREAVFLLWGVQYLNVDEPSSVAFTLSFFIVTAITSLIGAVFLPGIDRTENVLKPTAFSVEKG